MDTGAASHIRWSEGLANCISMQSLADTPSNWPPSSCQDQPKPVVPDVLHGVIYFRPNSVVRVSLPLASCFSRQVSSSCEVLRFGCWVWAVRALHVLSFRTVPFGYGLVGMSAQLYRKVRFQFWFWVLKRTPVVLVLLAVPRGTVPVVPVSSSGSVLGHPVQSSYQFP